MKIQSFALALAILLPVLASASLYGVTEVDKNLTVRDKNGTLKTISPGNYSTEWSYDGNKLKIKFYNSFFGKDVEFQSKIGAMNDPDNGEFSVDAKRLGQGFGIQGTVDTVETKVGPISATESCSVEWKNEYSCWETPDGGRECGWRDIIKYGTQSIALNIIQKVHNIRIGFVDAASGDKLANFPFQNRSETKEIIFRGECIIH